MCVRVGRLLSCVNMFPDSKISEENLTKMGSNIYIDIFTSPCLTIIFKVKLLKQYL